jgi:hypothetical protein
MELQDCRAFQTESVGKCGPRFEPSTRYVRFPESRTLTASHFTFASLANRP